MNHRLPCLAFLLFVGALSAVPLRIFHTNDTHGAYLPQGVKTATGKVMVGGYVNLEYYLTLERNQAPRSIYLDAGDQQTGSIFASLEYNHAIGGQVIDVFNQLLLDACTFGNHEFDQSYANTLQLTKLANYDFLSTNIVSQDGKQTLGKPYDIFTLDSLKVGVMGLTLTDLDEKVKRENVAGLKVLPYKEAIDRYIEEVDAQSDLIVLLTHMGFEADSLLATTLDKRIDLIIGGHSHTVVPDPVQVNGIYITSTGSNLNYLGMLDLDVVNDCIVSYQTRLIPLVQPPELPGTALNNYIQAAADSISQQMGMAIATIPETWTPDKYAPTKLSEWAAMALYKDYFELYHPDLAIINCGGLRKTIPAGQVTLKDMYELMPFNNYVVLFSCYGRDLVTMAELNDQHAADKPYDIVQTANAGWSIGSWGSDVALKKAYTVGGIPIDPDKVYRVISHDYILGQWDKYLGFEPFDVQETGELILDSSIRQIKLQYPLPVTSEK